MLSFLRGTTRARGLNDDQMTSQSAYYVREEVMFPLFLFLTRTSQLQQYDQGNARSNKLWSGVTSQNYIKSYSAVQSARIFNFPFSAQFSPFGRVRGRLKTELSRGEQRVTSKER